MTMEKRRPKRIRLARSPFRKNQLEKWRRQIAQELPDLLRRNRLADEAMKEKTFSGTLRRAIHQSRLSPMTIAEKAGLAWPDLDDFLTGEKTLATDAVDRLVKIVKLKLPASKPRGAAKAS